MIEPLAPRLANYFHFFGVRGANTSAEAAHIRMHLDRLMRDSQKRDKKAGK